MENKSIQNRLAQLRAAMEAEGIDYYLIPTADYHSSEYVSDYFKVREYYSNFTGSNGTLLVWKDGAGLWTDGRYFIQAEGELTGTGIELFHMSEEGVPTISEFLQLNIAEGQTLSFDGRCISMKSGRLFEKKLKNKQISFAYEGDLAGELMENRAPFPCEEVWALDEEIAGESAASKIARVREKLGMKVPEEDTDTVNADGVDAEAGARVSENEARTEAGTEAKAEAKADAFLLTKLDDIMWLLNLRGDDVECNPVAMSYLYLNAEEVIFFVQKKALSVSAKAALERANVRVEEYNTIVDFVKGLPAGIRVFVDPAYCSYTFYRLLKDGGQEIVKGDNPTEALKAVKNATELSRMRDIYLKDSIAVTRFIYWLKTHIGKEPITEVSAADYLEGLRREIPEFLGLSFPTISAYNANAAMMHYEATPADCATLAPEGMLLVDSGGQYLGGTTDVTRTIVLGPITEEMKHHYTLVAAANLQMTHAKWLSGCTGRNLDILARQPLWEAGLDYKCGTGHGVGYLLNVHEGPQALRYRYVKGANEAVFTEGMDVTNEPGVYIEGSHGIRIENVMVAHNAEKNEHGQFMEFETLTYVPLDPEAIEELFFTDRQLKYYHEYQRAVYEKLSPYLSEEERVWLAHETGAICR